MKYQRINTVDELGRDIQADVRLSRYREINAHLQQCLAGDDQSAIAFSVSQLTFLEERVYEKYYQPMQGQELVPITSKAGPAATTVTYQIIEKFGEAADASPTSNEVPYSDIGMAQKTIEIRHGLVGYKYTQQELRTSALLRTPLDALRMKAAMEIYTRRISEVALIGRTQYGLYGLFNQPNTIVAPLTAGSVQWDNAATTADQILAVINSDFAAYWANTQYVTLPSHLVLPPTCYTVALNKYRASASDAKLLDLIERNNLYTKQTGKPLTIVPGYKLDNLTAAMGGTGQSRIVYYNKDEDNLVMHNPMPLMFLSPQLDGVEIKVPGEFRYGAVEIRRPPTVMYRDVNLQRG
jgi:hypothetical protein